MGLDIHVINTPEQVQKVVDNFTTGVPHANRFLGLDCEWNEVRQSGIPEIPDLLQIARLDGYCVLIRLNVLRSMPRPLKNFLNNPNYWKLGVGVVEDSKKLKRGYDVSTQGVLDIRYLARELKVRPKGMSFLCENVLGIKKCQYNRHFCWTQQHLSERMQEYAATDAVNAVRIFDTLNRRRLEQKWGSEWKQWTEKRYMHETVNLWNKFVGRTFQYCDDYNDDSKFSDSIINNRKFFG